MESRVKMYADEVCVHEVSTEKWTYYNLEPPIRDCKVLLFGTS